jgi:hypothetical protein
MLVNIPYPNLIIPITEKGEIEDVYPIIMRRLLWYRSFEKVSNFQEIVLELQRQWQDVQKGSITLRHSKEATRG